MIRGVGSGIIELWAGSPTLHNATSLSSYVLWRNRGPRPPGTKTLAQERGVPYHFWPLRLRGASNLKRPICQPAQVTLATTASAGVNVIIQFMHLSQVHKLVFTRRVRLAAIPRPCLFAMFGHEASRCRRGLL